MTALVIGTENSGKSVLAEDLALGTGDEQRCYLATMKICDDASRERVRKHRHQREGKGFFTIELDCSLPDRIRAFGDLSHTTVLLECVSNLVGNEMHAVPDRLQELRQDCASRERFADRIAADLALIADRAHNMIMVTNDYPKDGAGYDDETRLYVQLLDLVNDRLTAFSDVVYDLRMRRENS